MAAVSEQSALPDFPVQVSEAQRLLTESIVRAGLNKDAYRYVLEAQVAVLAVLPAFVAEIGANAHTTQPPLTDAQVADLGQRLVRGCSAWAGGMVKAANLRSLSIIVLAVVAALGIGAAGGWYVFHPPAVECQAQPNGGLYCGYWQIPPPPVRK